MKNIVLIAIMCVGVTMMLSGCGKSAIECDDNDAQKTVMEIAEGEFKNQLATSSGFSYAGLKEMSGDEFQKWVAFIDKSYSEAEPTLVNIRTESMDNELEKSECAAEITYANGNKLDITYSLSKTTDGNLYAQVSGL